MKIDGFEIPDCMSFSIEYNQHKNYYMTVQEFLDSLDNLDIPKNVIDACTKSDSVWEVQMYENTPISFRYGVGATLKDALIMMNE